MRIFFLGTGAAEGIPALFCDCDVCEAARKRGGHDLRTRCTISIDDTIKVDLPPDTLAHVHAYRDRSFANLQHLLFTHSHDDHFAVRELQYLSPNFAPRRKLPLNIYGSNELLRKMLPELENFFECAPLCFQTLLPFDTTPIGHLAVTPIIAHHKSDELCFNYLFEENGKTFLYGCDTGWYAPETWEYLATRKLDALVMECGKGISNSTYPGHLSLNELVQVRERFIESGVLTGSTPFYTTHIAHTGLLLHDQMQELLTPYGIQVAYDGLEIIV